MKARSLNLSQSFNGEWTLSAVIDRDGIPQAKSLYDELKDKDLDIEVKPFRKKRSLDANAYFWKLCGELAAKIKIPPEDIYREYVKSVGGNYTIACAQDKDVKAMRNGWERTGKGWVTETFDSKIDGCTNVILYHGSSTYDTEQMSRLIDLLVFDCKENNIEVMTPKEIALLKDRWENET